MAILKPKDVENLWRQIEQTVAKSGGKSGWSYTVDAAGQYSLRHNGVLKGRGSHAEVVAKGKIDAARRRLDKFRKATNGHAVAAARLRRFQLESRLTERGL